MRKAILLINMIFFTSLLFGQNYSAQATLFFGKFKTASAINKYIYDNLPTQEECKYVFKPNMADSFFARMTKLKDSVIDMKQQPEVFFEGLKIASFLTEDIINEKGNMSGGMTRIKDVFLPGVTFYKVSFLKKKDDEYGVAYKYFVYINCRWILFPKPFEILSDQKKW